MIAVDAAEVDHTARVIDLVEQQPVLHLVVRAALDDLGLDLELDDRHRFLHLRHEADFLRRKTAVGGNLRNELFARVVLVGFQRERGERQDADAVTVFQRLHVAVAQAGADDVGDTRLAAGRCAHPQDVVVAPLDVDLRVFHQHVEDDVRARPAIVDVADHVQALDGQMADQLGKAGDEGQRAAGRDDGVDLALVVRRLVFDAFLVVEQFLDRFRHSRRQELADLLAAVLRTQAAAELDEVHQRQPAPLVLVRHAVEHQRRLHFRVIDQRREISPFRLRHRVREHLVDLPEDRAGAVAHHVLESLVFAVDVGEEMFGALRQLQ